MAGLFKDRRLEFKNPGAQNAFIEEVLRVAEKGVSEVAQLLGRSERTVREWSRGKIRMPEDDAGLLSRYYSIRLPEIERVVSLRQHLSQIAHAGGAASFIKNGTVGGSALRRKKNWRVWWEEQGKFRQHPLLSKKKQFSFPKKTESMAEFFGIMLGDGGMSRYQITVTLNCDDEREYIEFVAGLVQELFNVAPKVLVYPGSISKKSIAVIQISGKNLVDYLVENGLVVGNKVTQQVCVPAWILENEKFRIACLRGLVDTDGCFYTNKYISNGKVYAYRKIAFTNRSRPLLKFVLDELAQLGCNPCLMEGVDVRVTSKVGVDLYLKKIGTNNPKHLKRFAA